MADGLNQILADPQFRQLSPDAQRIVIGKQDAKFAGLSPEAQGIVLQKMMPAPAVSKPAPPPEGTALERVAAPFVGIGRGLKNLATGTFDAAQPRDAAEQQYKQDTHGYLLNPLAPVANILNHTLGDLTDQTIEAAKAAAKAAGQDESDAGVILEFASHLPVVGGLVERAMKGSVSADPNAPQGLKANYFTKNQLEAAGEGSTYAVAPELLEKSIPKLSSAATKTADVAKNAATNLTKPIDLKQPVRNYMGLGDRMVERTAKSSLDSHAEDVAKVNEQNAAATDKYQRNVDKVNQNQEALNKQTNLKNQQSAREWYEQTRQAQEIGDLQKEAVGQKAALGNKIATSSTKLAGDVRDLEGAVRNRGNALYDIVSEKTAGQSVPASTLADSVKYAEDKLLSGSAENIKQFRELVTKGDGTSLGQITFDGAPVEPGTPLYNDLLNKGLIQGSENLAFRDLQGYYTELGQKLASGNVPGDIYRAVKYVREQIGNQMNAMADKAGVLNDLNRAKAYWRDYEDTFHNMRPMAQGGSPVARVFRANPQDPGFVAAPITGKASARAVTMLGKYDPDLAQAAAQIAKDTEAAKKLPSTLKPKALPEAPEPIQAKTLQQPTPPDLKPQPEAPNLPSDVTAARQAKILKISSGLRSVSGWDLASIVGGAVQISRGELPTALGVTVLRHGVGRWLDKPEVIDWLSQPTSRDLDLLRQFAPKDQNTIQQGITQTLVKQARNGRDIDTSKWSTFLKPAQVSAIVNAVPKFRSASEIMEAMKNGDLDQKSGNAMLQRIKGKGGVTTRAIQ